MHANEQQEEQSGKHTTLILDSGAHPSFLKPGLEFPTYLTRDTQVATPNGRFSTNQKANIPIKSKTRTIKVKSVVYRQLPLKMLSVTAIKEKLVALRHVVALLLDEQGAAMLTKKQYRNIQPVSSTDFTTW